MALAGTSGKIMGRVVADESGQALVGANIMVDGTSLGSFTDANGHFVILNVKPGTYKVIASMVGYSRTILEGVIVRIDLTSKTDFSLTEKVIGMDEVVVTAKTEVVKVDIASSQTDITGDEIKALPIQSVDDAIGLSAGIDASLNIRGSSAYETSFMVDGMSMNDERSNTPYTTVSMNAVEAVNIQIGGFNAEYENARSGVINVVTKEGDKETYDGGVTVRYSAPATKYFGDVITDANAFFARPYNDDDVAWWGTSSEDYTDANENGQWDLGEAYTDQNGDGQYTDSPWDSYTQNSYNSWDGFNQYSETKLEDGNTGNDLTAAGWQQVYQYQHRRSANITNPDYTIDVGFGGPVPLISKALGNLRFFASYRGEQVAYAVPLARDTYNDNAATLKLTADISPKIKLNISGMYSVVNTVSSASWTSLPTGDNYFKSAYSVCQVASTDYYVYMDAAFCPETITRHSIGIKWSQQLNEHSFFEVDLQRMGSEYYTQRLGARDDSTLTEVVPDYYLDEQPYGYWYTAEGDEVAGYSDVVGMLTTWGGFATDRSSNYSNIAKADYKNQIDERNEFKTGVKFVYTEYNIDSWNDHPTNMFWNFYNEWNVNPWRLGAYVQDKLEYEGMVVNLGLRYDMSQANTDWYDYETYDELLTSVNGGNIDSLAEKSATDIIWALSPRFAIAHPISDKSKIYFNYGHFNALAQSRYRFTLDRLGSGKVNRLGNPEIPYCRTVQYELGYEQAIMDKYLLKVKAYYKDIKDQPTWTYYTSMDGNTDYSVADARNYKDVRGAEIELKSQVNEFFTYNMNFTYQVVSYGYFGNRHYYENPTEQMLYDQQNHISVHYQTTTLPQPLFKSYFIFKTPSNFSAFGLNPILTSDWSAVASFKWEEGSLTTYSQTNDPYVKNNVQWKDYYDLDLKVSKRIKAKPLDFSVFLDIDNVLNTKRLSSCGFSDLYDKYDYYNSLHFSDEDSYEFGDDRMGEIRPDDVDYTPIIGITDLSSYSRVGNELALYYDNKTESFFRWDGDAFVSASQEFVDNVYETKAYINMPDIESFTFLNPRKITLGITINF